MSQNELKVSIANQFADW